MATIVKIEFSPSQILTTRGLQTNGSAQRFFTGKMDPYVPFLNGPLKNTAIENEASVQYITPYAQRQYHENKGKGLRGKEWDKRCWADNGDQIVQFVADYVGGKAE